MKKISLVLSTTLLFATNVIASQSVGYFVDAPITGIQYITSSGVEGETNKGAYTYNPGDSVDFFLGTGSHAFHLAAVSAEEWVSPNSMTVKPTLTINMTRLLLAMSEFDPEENELIVDENKLNQTQVQGFLSGLNLFELDAVAKHYSIELPTVGEAALHLQSSYEYIKNTFDSKDIVYSPKDKELRDILIKTRDSNNTLCFYDLSKTSNPDYIGPLGKTTYKITNKGIYEYPDYGDRYGSSDKNVSSCNIDIRARRETEEFHSVSDFSGWSGLFACAIKGCSRTDLSGYVVEDYDSGSSYKYRANAISFNPTTQILLNKKQGLGEHKKIIGANNEEIIWFTFATDAVSPLSFDGQWQEKKIHKNIVQYRCLKIKSNEVWATDFKDKRCSKWNVSSYNNVSDQFKDMWWLNKLNEPLYFYHLNMPVMWQDGQGSQHYTTWEYLPISKKLDDGIVYRYQQTLDMQTQSLLTSHISELTKL
ncbi:hypothetical protein KP803_00460 [Vibrio sp. ZSDE26]|uniref:Chromosome partitioning protein ParA n=1 Tax=Vibrio amylolyticus TaxID=2847292 RepID=A0A9X2BFH0_9VIBR|nr:hypothetical protein [Vibrio amylolyticus]MCK6261739.1 hypothetical protein [Vibrio amylolyticus]